MSFPRDAYPYTNFHELNLGYFITHFREIFSQWADLYDQMTNWKDATDEELATWKAGVEDDLNQREAALRAELETWKAQTGQDIAGWEDATLAALTAWQTATQAVFEAIRVEAAGSATAAAASAGDAATAKTAAETAQAAAEAAAASIASSAAQIATNTADISDLKTQIALDSNNLLSYATIHKDKYYNNSEAIYEGYCYFIVPVTEGTIYYISPGFRYLSKQGANIAGETNAPYTYTADFTGDLYITFDVKKPGWIVTTLQDYNNVRPFDTPSLFKNAMMQTTGNSVRVPMSQKAVSDALSGALDDVELSNKRLQAIVSEDGFSGMTLVEGKFYDNTGAHDLSSYNYYIVPVIKGEVYHFNPRIRMFVIEDGENKQSDTSDNIKEFTSQYTGIAYITVYANQTVTMTAGRTDETLSKSDVPADAKATGDAIGSTNKDISELINKNEVNYTNLHTGYMNLAGTIYSIASSYQYTDKISVVAGETIYTGKARFVTFFNGNTANSSVGLEYPIESVKTHEFTVPNDIDGMVISLYANDTNKYIRRAENMFSQNAENEIKKFASEIDLKDPLAGKKWWACGDSFTEWTTEQYVSADYPNIDGLQHYKTYPFWIGERTGMTVYNFAVSGQTMAMPADPGTFTNAFSNNKYTQIPADVDYITLKFGINDNNHATGHSEDGEDTTGYIPIGDITDTGTASFCGAYNTVLEYLIENHPNAKIGILVTNGCSSDEYRQKTIAIAEKWGLPYLDENGEARCPALIRSSSPNVSSTVKSLRMNAFAADYPTNTHQNVAGHKFESTIVEAFLRNL